MKWDPEDREKALIYLEYEASLCQKCGTNPEEWMDEDGKLAEPPPFITKSVMCHGCATLEEARASVDKGKVSSITHRLIRIPKRLGQRELEKWQMKRSRLD
jgi:hypothetical protein